MRFEFEVPETLEMDAPGIAAWRLIRYRGLQGHEQRGTLPRYCNQAISR
jgi:hypothetical protein